MFGIEIIDHFDSFSGNLFLFDVGISHRGLNVGVTQNLLDLIEIESILNQSSGVGVSEGVC